MVLPHWLQQGPADRDCRRRFPRMSPSVVVPALVPNAVAPDYVASQHQHEPADVVQGLLMPLSSHQA